MTQPLMPPTPHQPATRARRLWAASGAAAVLTAAALTACGPTTTTAAASPAAGAHRSGQPAARTSTRPGVLGIAAAPTSTTSRGRLPCASWALLIKSDLDNLNALYYDSITPRMNRAEEKAYAEAYKLYYDDLDAAHLDGCYV
jgi:hypothetical protein